jgi:hypothetical protein
MRKGYIVPVGVIAWILVSGRAYAIDVATGCDAPKSENYPHTYYVDPLKGAKENDGSRDHPWRTLEEVLDPAAHLVATHAYARDKSGNFTLTPVNTSGPVKPGDAIYLMSGDHGSPDLEQLVNDDFISVLAAPGQTPVVDSLSVRSSSHWLFRGIKFQGVRPGAEKYKPLVGVLSHAWLGPSDNIVFSEDSFSTADRTDDWTPEDWVRKPYATGLRSEARCTSIVDNHFFNLRDAIGISGDNSLIQHNSIEDFGNDGIDMMSSHLVIRGNKIGRGRHTPAEPLHPDAIQGWSLNGATNRDVVIDSNSVINLNDSKDNERQGIDIFDGHWDGLVVSNNLVITNHWHGIALSGVNNTIVVNNTVIPARDDRLSWITIHDSKDKAPSGHVIVRNNIAAQFIIEGDDVTFDHNIAEKLISIGGQKSVIPRREIGDHNSIDPRIFQSFVDFDPKNSKFDLRPTRISPAVQAGSDDSAPALDIEGRRRASPVDIGAYAR